jgi:hypothetical protein
MTSIRIAPPTPPLRMLPMIDPRLRPAPPAVATPSAPRTQPPMPPPTIPAIEFPAVPRL